MSFSLVTGALATAAIVLVQGAGVAEAAPNPGDVQPNPNQDIIAQGIGNLASGFFRGIAVGGSVGQTALNVSVGGRTRWAAIWSGIWMLVILAAFSGLVTKIAVPTLGAILIFAGVSSLRPAEIVTILRTGRTSQVAVITTFGATLFLPVAAAVGIGVALSLLLQLDQEAMDRSDAGSRRVDPGCLPGCRGMAGQDAERMSMRSGQHPAWVLLSPYRRRDTRRAVRRPVRRATLRAPNIVPSR
jgi:SulP family sulfate permease